MNKFRKYLLGRRFVLRTDHRALVALLSQRAMKTSSARTERWREKISCFDYEIEYIKGADNQMADWLSRSGEEVDHELVPLKEEFVLNEVRNLVPDSGCEYSSAMNELVQVVRKGTWGTRTEGSTLSFSKEGKRRSNWWFLIP